MRNKTRIVAIDYGKKRVGLAISDEGKTMALPWKMVAGDIRSIVDAIQSRIQEIEKIVIGLPLLMNGQKGDMALFVEKFAKKLEEMVLIPVVFLDERLTSKQADVLLQETNRNAKQRKEHLDTAAATILLNTYLSSLSQDP